MQVFAWLLTAVCFAGMLGMLYLGASKVTVYPLVLLCILAILYERSLSR